MAEAGKFICNECKHVFDAQIGRTMFCEEYACEDCDTSILQHWSEPEIKSKCEICSGKLSTGLNRKCMKCGSRNTEIKVVSICLD
jgi:DNA-directed RNA polymerase subunit RPC12/RpoP